MMNIINLSITNVKKWFKTQFSCSADVKFMTNRLSFTNISCCLKQLLNIFFRHSTFEITQLYENRSYIHDDWWMQRLFYIILIEYIHVFLGCLDECQLSLIVYITWGGSALVAVGETGCQQAIGLLNQNQYKNVKLLRLVTSSNYLSRVWKHTDSSNKPSCRNYDSSTRRKINKLTELLCKNCCWLDYTTLDDPILDRSFEIFFCFLFISKWIRIKVKQQEVAYFGVNKKEYELFI